MKLSIDEVEEAINVVLAGFPEPAILPVIDSDGNEVGESFQGMDFYSVFNPNSYPEIYDGLRGRIVLFIRGTHVRIFEIFKEVEEFSRGLESPMKIISGPPLQDMTQQQMEDN